MPRDDENKVFDVSKPGKTGPDPTSRPVIVGHHPQMSDPMMAKDGERDSRSTPIQISVDEKDSLQEAMQALSPSAPSITPENPISPSPEPSPVHTPAHENAHVDPWENAPEPAQPPPSAPEKPTDNSTESHFTSLDSLLPDNSKNDKDKHHGDDSNTTQPGTVFEPASPLQVPRGAGPYRRLPRIIAWLLLIVLLIATAAYLVIDLGLVKSNVELPFHIFNKQKTSTVVAPPPAPTTRPAVSQDVVMPTGFSQYKLEGTELSFAYPTAWGAPTATADSGFSKRGAKNKSDGTYAHLIKFAINKDVELAATSSKYLPSAHTALYYDFLQWCIGTNDGKFYKQTLHYTSANGVDTPSTITCDQGPLADATKLDNLTIVQPKTKDAAGVSLGDLYSKNLGSTDLPVVRVKDATMTNAEQIKKLLATVKISSP